MESRTTCFNPRARVGRDQIAAGPGGGIVAVSIHAPAWGATRHHSDSMRLPNVSIHAPAWGATTLPGSEVVVGGVSIHAPAWGATRIEGRGRALSRVSIHAPAWGATPIARKCARRRQRFQSTRPRGARQQDFRDAWQAKYGFNPRARVGRDLIKAEAAYKAATVSIHAPAWGATLACSINATGCSGFNPRARVGRDSLSKLPRLQT